MNDLKVFDYKEQQIRTVQINGEPWFVLKDLCLALSITNRQGVIKRLEDDEKGVQSMYTLGGEQRLIVVNESGLYTVILRSDKPEAKEFRRWITHEVLPQIRRTGSYSEQVVPVEESIPVEPVVDTKLELARLLASCSCESAVTAICTLYNITSVQPKEEPLALVEPKVTSFETSIKRFLNNVGYPLHGKEVNAVYIDFLKFCKPNDYPACSLNMFSRRIHEFTGLKGYSRNLNGLKKRIYE